MACFTFFTVCFTFMFNVCACVCNLSRLMCLQPFSCCTSRQTCVLKGIHKSDALFEPKGSKLTLFSLRLMVKITCAGCLGASLAISDRCNLLLKCAQQPKIAKTFTKASYFLVHGRSRSSMSVYGESSSVVFVVISNKFVLICNRFHARRVSAGKLTTF